jgi:hypothetical protein
VVQSNLCHALCKMLHTIRVLDFVRQAACGHGFDHFLSYRIESSGSDRNQDKHEHLVVCTEEFQRSTNWLCKIGSNHKLLLRNASLPSLICKPILRTISCSYLSWTPIFKMLCLLYDHDFLSRY